MKKSIIIISAIVTTLGLTALVTAIALKKKFNGVFDLENENN